MSEPPVETPTLPELTKGDPFYRSVLLTGSGLCAGYTEQKGANAFVAHISATSPGAKFDILLLRHHYSGTEEDTLIVDGEGFGERGDENWSVRIQMNNTFEEESVLEALKYNGQGMSGRLSEEEKEQFIKELTNIDRSSIVSSET